MKTNAAIGICPRNRAQLLASTLNGLTQLAEPHGFLAGAITGFRELAAKRHPTLPRGA